MTHKIAFAFFLVPLSIASGALAHPFQPPPEAYDACKEAGVDDACEVSFRDQTVSGTCMADRDDSLFCRPNLPPPPQEAFDACQDASEGDACKVTFHERTISGTCEVLDEAGLLCKPTGAHRSRGPGRD